MGTVVSKLGHQPRDMSSFYGAAWPFLCPNRRRGVSSISAPPTRKLAFGTAMAIGVANGGYWRLRLMAIAGGCQTPSTPFLLCAGPQALPYPQSHLAYVSVAYPLG